MVVTTGKNSGREREIVVGVIGQPNVGKSTLFNVLTGEISHVANWPGTTVERKEGVREYKGKIIRFVDLPGIYGLSASTTEEVIARKYIVEEKPDLVLVLVDSTAVERTMYLAIQVLELTPKVVIALTKSDLTHSLGIHIHVDRLESKLSVPVVPVSAIKGYGLRELLDAIIDVAEGRRCRREPIRVNYGSFLESTISDVERVLSKSALSRKYPLRWLAIRLLEGDPELEKELELLGEDEVVHGVRRIRESLARTYGRELMELFVAQRFKFIDSLLGDVVVRVEKKARRYEELSLTELATALLDRLIQHPLMGPVVSFISLLILFSLIFAVNTGFPFNVLLSYLGFSELAELIEEYSISGLLGLGFTYLSTLLEPLLKTCLGPQVTSLIVDGVIPGVGAILSFLPLIMLISLLIATLEDSGLAPRFAISFHNFFSRFGLSGRAIYPFMIGLGCNLPAVLASRTALEEEERRQLIVSVPFIPCQARLVVILAFVTTYIKNPLGQALALLSLYAISFLVALLTSILTRRVVYRRKEPPELVIELPPIHRPSGKVLWWLTWDYSKHFLRKAGIIIVGLSIVTWMLLSYGPEGYGVGIEKTYGALLGKLLAPVISVLYGLDAEKAWKVGFALLHGFIAKEAFLEATSLLYGGVSIDEALRALGFTLPSLMAFLVFFTLYVPCLPTIAVIYQESRSVRLTLSVILYMIGIGLVASQLVYLVLASLTFLYS
ncbi:MAG: ferrous iron transport protein B [Thermoprotei archaeon]|nr:MAG: ferrous iron transport protein B [Thermoprotei archaeon]